jgi:hypothetical protein
MLISDVARLAVLTVIGRFRMREGVSLQKNGKCYAGWTRSIRLCVTATSQCAAGKVVGPASCVESVLRRASLNQQGERS